MPPSSILRDVTDALQQVNDALALHGGSASCTAADPATGVVTIAFSGACAGCPFAEETLHNLVEEAIRARVPSITEVRLAAA